MANCANSISIKKAAINHKKISASYHEAGHVIYGLLHFMNIESVQVIEDSSGDITGNTDYSVLIADHFSDSELVQKLVRFEIGMCYSGQLSEKIHYKYSSGSDKLPIFLRDGSSYDTTAAACLIKKFRVASPGRGRYKYKRKLLKEVEEELVEYWSDVILISHNLFSDKKLNFDKLKSLLCKESINSLFWKKHIKDVLNIHKNSARLDDKDLRIKLKQSGLL